MKGRSSASVASSQPLMAMRRALASAPRASARYHLRPAVEGDLDVLCLLQSAPEVDDEAGMSRQLFEHAIIDDMPGFRPVQIDDVEATDASVLESLGHFQRVFVVDFPCRVVALRQSDALAFYHVDGRNYFYHTILL